MTFLHSTQTQRYQPLAKTVNGKTRVADKAARKAAEAKAERDCYRAVDARDGLTCRITGVRLTLRGSLLKRVQRHHMVKRSRGGKHLTSNVITVSPHVHELIHVKGVLRLSGNADGPYDLGRPCGVLMEWLVDGKWLRHGLI